MWRLADGTPVRRPLHGHTGLVFAVAITALPDGTPVIASGGDDGTVRVWRLADGAPTGEPLRGHTGRVFAVAAGGQLTRPDSRLRISGAAVVAASRNPKMRATIACHARSPM